MTNIRCIPVVGVIAFSLFVVCTNSPFEPSTNLGAPIFSALDSTITDPSKNFKPVSIALPLVVTNSYTDSALVLIPGHFYYDAVIRTGYWWHEYSIAYLSFNGDSLMRVLDDSSDSLTGMQLQLRSTAAQVNKAVSSSKLYIYPAKTATTTRIVASDVDSLLHVIASRGADTNDLLLTFTLADTRTIRDFLKRTRTGSDTSYDDIAFMLTTDSLFEFNSRLASNQPLLKTWFNTDTIPGPAATSWKRDSLFLQTKTSEYTVSETEQNSMITAKPVTSAAAGRYAVMNIDLTKFWQEFIDAKSGKNYRNILAAYLRVAVDSAQFLNSNVATVYYGLYGSPQSLLDTNDMTSLQISRSNNTSTTSFTLDSLVIYDVNKLVANKPPTGYLYLAIPKTNSPARIYWKSSNSISIGALLSNPW